MKINLRKISVPTLILQSKVWNSFGCLKNILLNILGVLNVFSTPFALNIELLVAWEDVRPSNAIPGLLAIPHIFNSLLTPFLYLLCKEIHFNGFNFQVFLLLLFIYSFPMQKLFTFFNSTSSGILRNDKLLLKELLFLLLEID